MSIELVHSVRERILPMLDVIAEEYRVRVPEGFPIVTDQPAQGTVGLQLDPAHSLYLVANDDGIFADFYYRSSRYDTRATASREKFGGSPYQDRRVISPQISDQGLRNLVAELCSRFNSQQTLIHITDT